jgi:putative ABC transport system permease protein
MKLFLLILKNLRRNRLRSILTALAIILLVAIYSMIATVMGFLDEVTTEKSSNVYLVITERYRIPSRFDRSLMERIVYPGSALHEELLRIPGFDPRNYTIWHFVGFTTDPNDPPKDSDLQFFVIATVPDTIPTMVEGMEDVDPRLGLLMKRPPQTGRDNIGVLMGPQRLARLGKKVGDVFPAKSISHREGTGIGKPIEMDIEIVGELPGDRWGDLAVMDYEYLDRVLKEKKNEMDGKVMLGWLLLPDQESASRVAALIEKRIPELKCETAASARSRFMEPVKGLLWGIRYLLSPAIVVVITLIIANAISITVRERRQEIAVLKVLGFQGTQLMILVVGEALLLGVLAGLLGSVTVFTYVNYGMGGISMGGFFPHAKVPVQVFTWGPVLGAGTAFFASLLPAWLARSVKVSEVFAKVA